MSKYINNLTNDEIEEFFNLNGYELTKDLTDDDGFPIDSIERDEDNIFIRAQKTQKDEIETELKSFLAKKKKGLLLLSALASLNNGYSRNIDLIYFSDFYMSKFCITEEDKTESELLCSNYIKYMVQKFPTYKNDFLEYCNSLNEDELENE